MDPACQIPANTLVLVTGATGFTGSVLVRRLREAGVRVRAIARAHSATTRLDALSVEWVRGNVYDAETVRQAMQGVDYVFHVAAAYREAGLTDDEYRRVHVESTQRLAEEAVKNPHFKRFIQVSTVGVHGHIDDPPSDETYRFKPGDIYQKTKAEAEIWLKDFATANKLPFTILRPAAIIGGDDKRLLKIFKLATLPIFPLLGQGKNLYHLIHVEDLTRIMIIAATHPAAVGEAFICGNPDVVTLTEMGRTIADTLGYPFRPVRFPATPVFWLADLCEAVCKPLGLKPPLYRRRVAFYTKDRAFNTTKLRARLGFQYEYTNRTGLEKTAWDYVAKGWLKARKPR